MSRLLEHSDKQREARQESYLVRNSDKQGERPDERAISGGILINRERSQTREIFREED